MLVEDTCWVGGLGAALERSSGMGVLSRREHLGRIPGREHFFLTKMMKSNRNGTCQCQARQVEREQKKMAPASASLRKEVFPDPCHSSTLPTLVS